MITQQICERCAIFSGALFLLAACSGSSETTTTPGTDQLVLPGLLVTGLMDQTASEISNPWLAAIRTFRSDSRVPAAGDIEVETIQYSSRTLQQHIDWYGGQVVMDTCEINTDDDTGGGGDNGSVPYVSAGDSIVINTPAGPWFTLNEGEVGIYLVDDELPGAIPAGASLSMSGSVFPSVGAIPLNEPAVPVRLAPDVGAVSVDSEYRWQAVGGPGVFIRLSFLEYDSDGNFVDFRIYCDVEDDGEFELPADVLFAIAGNNNTLEARYTRNNRGLSLVEGIVTFSRISVAE